MSVWNVVGKIGAGKTYFVMYWILKNYFNYDEIVGRYMPKKNIVIITNIDKFKMDHYDLKEEISNKGIDVVFSPGYVEELRRENGARPVFYIIDEAQMLFDRKFYSRKIFDFFEYSRHHGIDIFLITQNINNLSRELQDLAEENIKATSRTLGSDASFTYKFLTDDEVTRSITVKRDKNIFRMYRSFIMDETEKPRPVIMRLVASFAVLVLLCVLALKYIALPMWSPKGSKGLHFEDTKKVVAHPVSPFRPVPVVAPTALPLPPSGSSHQDAPPGKDAGAGGHLIKPGRFFPSWTSRPVVSENIIEDRSSCYSVSHVVYKENIIDDLECDKYNLHMVNGHEVFRKRKRHIDKAESSNEFAASTPFGNKTKLGSLSGSFSSD